MFFTDPDPGLFSNTDPDLGPDPGKKHIFSKALINLAKKYFAHFQVSRYLPGIGILL